MTSKIGTLISTIIVLILLCGIQNSFAYVKEQDGVVFHLKKEKVTDPDLLKIQVYSDNIIRVIASPADNFSKIKSLMAITKNQKAVNWNVSRKGRIVKISTPKIYVNVDTVTGALAFYDHSGNLILHEIKGGGKIITPAVVMGEKTYHIQELFDSPPYEAFYGLGQHQQGIMNYKGHDVDLWQYNIAVAVPFLVSNRNYGILWDNNSRTKFGDIRNYEPISSLKLFDKNGEPGGLTAEYFKDKKFTSLFTSRIEKRIEYKYDDVHDSFPKGFLRNVHAVRWSGEIGCNKSGVYKFQLFSSNYIKMWLNNKLVVNTWRQNWLPWKNLVQLYMEKGKRYKIKIEWSFDNLSYIGLDYLPPAKRDYSKVTSLYSVDADQIDYYFIYGKDMDQVIHGYREITGKAPMMPEWAMGFWQSRERYKTQKQLLSVVKEFRERKIPLDNIVQDWFYWKQDKWGSHIFDRSRYPDPKGMINELHNKFHTHIMISVWPKFYKGTKHYNEFKEHDWLYMRNIKLGQKDWVGYEDTFYDPYSLGARKLFWNQLKNTLFADGIDAWWLDATEPDIQSNLSRKETILRESPTALGSASRYLNSYSLMDCEAVYNGQRKTDPNKRVFILTRSAFAGQQRYASATWSGDIPARWEALRDQISAGLNFSLSGIPYWTSDIGGFAPEARYVHPDSANLDEWRELMTRWFQFGTFCPLFRVHGEFPFREMFNVAPESNPAYKSMLAYDKLRYRLMPYIYSLTGMVTQDDYTIMRALVMDFGNDKKVQDINNEFMFGPSLLINPVTKYKARERKVYLPSGTGWYRFQTGKYFEGGQTIQAKAPYTNIPVFVKAGSIVPWGPAIQYTDEKPEDPIRLFVYTGDDGSFKLYEDEDTNYDYEKGMFSIIPLKYNDKSQTLIIGKRQGQFPGMLKKRTFEIVWVSKKMPKGLNFSQKDPFEGIKPDIIIHYNGKQQIVKK